MKKIEFFVSDEKLKIVDKLRKKEQFTRAELMRRALDQFLYSKMPNLNIEAPKFQHLTEGGNQNLCFKG